MKNKQNNLNENSKEPSSIFNDQLWYYFFVSNENADCIDEFCEKDADKAQALNEFRKYSFNVQTAPSVKAKTISNRSVLKKYYDQQEPVSWVATAGDVSLPKGRQSGNLLLYHVAIRNNNDNENMINIGYNIQDDTVNIIDHHTWLRISDIKYFGEDKDFLDISYGDVIFGTSLVKKYTNREGEDSYTLGTTIINKSGYIQGENMNMNANDPDFLASSNAQVVDYNHDGHEMLRLTYTKKAIQKISKMSSRDIYAIAKTKYYLTTDYKKYNTYNYHDLIKKQAVQKIREEMKDTFEEDKTFTYQRKGSPITFEAYAM